MNKYLHITKTYFQESVNFRVDFFVARIRNLVLLFTVYYLYTTTYKEGNSLGGLSQNQMVTYVVLASLFYSFIFVYSDNAIAAKIASGDLNFFLIKPLNTILYEYFRSLGSRIFAVVFGSFEILILYLVFKPEFYINLKTIIPSIVALFLCSIIFFFLNIYTGISAFVMQNAYGPRFIIRQVLELFTGRLFPLSILPSLLQTFLKFSPFWYIVYFPLEIYFGSKNWDEILFGFGILFFWIIALYIIYKLLWKISIKHYEGYGI